MSTLAIVLIVLAAVLVLFFLGGLVASRRRDAANSGSYADHLLAADRALEAARAEDKGWDRAALESAARDALKRERPGYEAAELQLVLVDDKPGVEEDRAHFLASGNDGPVRVILTRRGGSWALEALA